MLLFAQSSPLQIHDHRHFFQKVLPKITDVPASVSFALHLTAKRY
jgi:predicted HD phosphohydrolase